MPGLLPIVRRAAGLLALAGVLAGPVRAQLPPPMRLGEPTAEDFAAQPVAGDTTAAVVLCDYGTSHYENYSGVLHLVHERMVRLKVLGKAGYRYAQVQVALYDRPEGNDYLGNLRGCTYVRQPDGSVRKTPLDASNVYTEQVTYRLNIRRFALPGVREGAVIEYAYTVSLANGGKLPDWNFQWNVPVRWSEYRVNVPRIYRYHLVYLGYLPLARNDTYQQATTELSGNGTLTDAPAEAHRWVVRDAPAWRPEPYQLAPEDYRAHISCELVGVQWPGREFRNLGTSWEQKCQELRTSAYFGKILEHDGFLQEQMQPLRQFHRDPAELAAAVRDLVQQRVRCDGPFRWWTGTSLRRTWEQRQGSVADANLLLVAALRQAGLNASPVLLSTGRREALELAHLDSFDYVLALVELPATNPAGAGPHDLLLDATEPLLPATVLPRHCVGRPGHTVPAEGAGRWLQLPALTGSTRYRNVRMTLDAQGNLSSEVREELSGYAAQDGRRRLARLGTKGVAAELAQQHPECELTDLQPVAAANPGQPLGLRYTLRQPALPPAAEQYVQPLRPFAAASSPFVATERRFPVDFGMQQQETIVLTLILPPGCVAELPPPLALALPDQGGRYVYASSSPAPGTVQLVSRFALDKLVYTPQEYHALRELYDHMLAKQAEALVVKKQ